jgi:hypothetical protein
MVADLVSSCIQAGAARRSRVLAAGYAAALRDDAARSVWSGFHMQSSSPTAARACTMSNSSDHSFSLHSEVD